MSFAVSQADSEMKRMEKQTLPRSAHAGSRGRLPPQGHVCEPIKGEFRGLTFFREEKKHP